VGLENAAFIHEHLPGFIGRQTLAQLTHHPGDLRFALRADLPADFVIRSACFDDWNGLVGHEFSLVRRLFVFNILLKRIENRNLKPNFTPGTSMPAFNPLPDWFSVTYPPSYVAPMKNDVESAGKVLYEIASWIT
jgi:hypothetical protein